MRRRTVVQAVLLSIAAFARCACIAAPAEDPYAAVVDASATVTYVPQLPSMVPASALPWERAADGIIESVGAAAKRRAAAADIYYEAKRAGLDPLLVFSMVEVLSRFDASRIGGPRNAGLLQLDPAIHTRFGNPENSLLQAKYNLRLGLSLFRLYLERAHGDVSLALERFLIDAAPQEEPARRMRDIFETESVRAAKLP